MNTKNASVPADLLKDGLALGLTEEQVSEMWEKVQSAPVEIREVTRWTRCPNCRKYEVRTISWAGGSEGAWSCGNDTCWSEYVDTFSFTKAEMEFFRKTEAESE